MKGTFLKMINKINILNLIKEHLSTFYLKDKTKKDNKRRDGKALFLFFIVPLFVSIIIVFLFGNMNDSLSNSLLTCLSILSPLMFGFFPFIYDLIDNDNINPKSKFLIQEFKANVLFTMILSFSALACILIWTLVNNNLDFLLYLKKDIVNNLSTGILLFLSGVIYYLLLCLGFHILMIIQRFNFLINQYNKFKINNP